MMKRYSPAVCRCAIGTHPTMDKDEDGRYVELSAVIAMVKERMEMHGGLSTMYHVENDENQESVEACKESAIRELLDDLLSIQNTP